MQDVTIYALCEPDTGVIRYVGKALRLEARLRVHRCEALTLKFSTHKDNWLRSLNGAEPMVRILDVVPHERWEAAERHWIAKLRSEGCVLTNHAPGGASGGVIKHSEASKQKMRETALRLGIRPPSQLGVKASEATRAKHRNRMRRQLASGWKQSFKVGGWNKDKNMSAAAIEANRLCHKGVPWSQARWDALKRRQIALAGKV